MTADGRALHVDHVSSISAPAVEPRRRRLRPRHLWVIPGLAIAIYANALAGDHGVGIVPLLVFAIVPHLTVLLGIGQPHAPGQMAARAVPLFNVMHHPVPPLVLVGFAAAGVLSPFWLVGGLAWFSHIVMDLAVNHGLRTPDGWRRSWWAR